MLDAYLAIALVTGLSVLTGRAILLLLGRAGWTGLEPALGLAAIFTTSGILARLPGQGKTVAAGLGLLLLAAAAVAIAERLRRHRGRTPETGSEPANVDASGAGARTPAGRSPRTSGRRGRAELVPWAATLLAALAALSLPFLLNGRWGPIGVGVNNDLGLHLAWAEWLTGGLGPVAEPGYPLGPHGLAGAISRLPGIELAPAFTGLIVAISAITAITALAALLPRGIGIAGRGEAPITFELSAPKAVAAALLVAFSYLSIAYFGQAAFKETSEALFVLAFTILMSWIPAGLGRWRALCLIAILAGGIAFSYSFAGLAWPVAIGGLWAVTRRETWAALRPSRLRTTLLTPFTAAAAVLACGATAVLVLSSRYGFGEGFSNVAGSDTYGPVSPLEALGLWPESSYRLEVSGWPELAVPIALVSTAALALSLAALLIRRKPILPVAILACAIVYLASLPVSGDYSRAKALMIVSPLVMLAIAPALLRGPQAFLLAAAAGRLRHRLARIGWVALAAVFLAGSAYSSFLVLRDTPVAPAGHLAELQELVPRLEGRWVLYSGQDRYAAHALRGADPAVPLVEFPDERISESVTKPFDTGSAYSPIDFDSFDTATLNRFRYVITGSAAWNSGSPESFEELARTDSFVLWERTGETAERHTLIEGTEAAAPFDCASPEYEIFSRQPGQAAVVDRAVIGERDAWDPGRVIAPGEEARIRLTLPPGSWRLSLQYFAPAGLELEAPGFSNSLIPSLDGQRPEAISLANDGQYWPAGELRWPGGEMLLTVRAPEPSLAQSLLGHDPPSYLGNLVAVNDRGRATLPLSEACDEWMDWYRSETLP